MKTVGGKNQSVSSPISKRISLDPCLINNSAIVNIELKGKETALPVSETIKSYL